MPNARPRSIVSATCAAACLFVSLALTPARADERRPVAPPAATNADESTSTARFSAVPATITFTDRDTTATFATEAKTVGEFLSERAITPAANDLVQPAPETPLADGTHVTYRAAVHLVIVAGKHRTNVITAAPTIAATLAQTAFELGPHDTVVPDRSSAPYTNEVVRVTHIVTWVERQHTMLAAHTIRRNDETLAAGHARIVARGVTGIRETTYRYTRTSAGRVQRALLSSLIIRNARPAVIAIGTQVPAPRSFATFASNGLSAALHIAGRAIHMIATAYTAQCYGCSGITASGVRAGFGIIAVDPRVIPLGTHLFVPGYGRAIAGDTGGAIIGHRVDLGMNTVAAATKFGRRPVTVYVLK